MTLPPSFERRMQTLLGDEYAAFYRAMTEQASVHAVRLNSYKQASEQAVAAFARDGERLSYARDAFVCETEGIGKHPLHHAGAFYVQDPGAMATVHALQVQKGWRVADLCAAPGGKSSQLASYVGEEGFVLANEISLSRCKALAGNLERLGCPNVLVTNTDAATVAAWFPSYFDLVLVDAPCSGEGMFRKYGHATEEWSEANVQSCAVRQKEILNAAAGAVATEGYLLYSTCTFSQEENEGVVDAFLSAHPEFSVCDAAESVKAITACGVPFEGCAHPNDILRARRFYPHISPGEGQFLCLLRKNGHPTDARTVRDSSMPLSKEEERLIFDFVKDTMARDIGALLEVYELRKTKDILFLRPKGIPCPPYGVYCPGLVLGHIQKGRIEPHHYFFSALGGYFQRKADFQSADAVVSAYLRGETFATALPDGFAVVTVDGCPLGGIKVKGGIAKNYYPKGLRSR